MKLGVSTWGLMMSDDNIHRVILAIVFIVLSCVSVYFASDWCGIGAAFIFIKLLET